MKLYLYPIIALGLIASSCNNDAVEEPQPSVIAKNTITYSPSAVNRTLDEAISIANEAKGMLNNSKSSRAGINREIDLTDGIKYVVSNVSRSNPDTLLYILNYKDNAGFAVISTRRSTEALLAVTESGTYTSPEDCDNPGFNMFMDMATAYVANAPVNPTTPSGVDGPFEIQEVKREEIIWANDTVRHNPNVQWGQDGLYGAYCPNGVAGCSNTAAGTAMNYFKYPKTITLTHDNNKILVLDWDNINKHTLGSGNYYCCSEDTHNSIGLLLRELGHRSKSQYNGTKGSLSASTGTDRRDIRNTLSQLGYNVGPITKYSQGCVKSKLGDGIILMRGEDSESSGGHMWVVEGYYYYKKQMIEYVRPISSPEWTEIENVTTEILLNWMNWGWNGYADGFVYDGVFSAKDAGNFNKNVLYFTVNL